MMVFELEYFFLCSEREAPVTHPEGGAMAPSPSWIPGGTGEGAAEVGCCSAGPSRLPGRTQG